MDGQIIPRTSIEEAAASAVAQRDTTNPYPVGTSAHLAWHAEIARICAQDVA